MLNPTTRFLFYLLDDCFVVNMMASVDDVGIAGYHEASC